MAIATPISVGLSWPLKLIRHRTWEWQLRDLRTHHAQLPWPRTIPTFWEWRSPSTFTTVYKQGNSLNVTIYLHCLIPKKNRSHLTTPGKNLKNIFGLTSFGTWDAPPMQVYNWIFPLEKWPLAEVEKPPCFCCAF